MSYYPNHYELIFFLLIINKKSKIPGILGAINISNKFSKVTIIFSSLKKNFFEIIILL
jgi:hypothetical protein